MEKRTALSIDPGSSKCGTAVVRLASKDKVELLESRVVPTDQLLTYIGELIDRSAFDFVILGDGTRSRPIQEAIREKFPALGMLVVDEKDTTQEARARYWEHNPRRGWRRLLPASLQTPPVPFDDYVALILAERVFLE